MPCKNLRGFVFAALLVSIFTVARAAADEGKVPVWPDPDWQTASPEDEGMDSAALARLIAFGSTRSFDSLLIARHGRIVLDVSYAPYTADIPHAANSATKAIVGTLVAMLREDGKLDSFDHRVLEFFADRKIADLDDRKRAITVQHLLDMTSGFEWDEGIEGGKASSLDELGRHYDWVQYILDRPMAHAPGEAFYYDSGNPDLLSAIITKLTGKRAAEFANERLFGPLGIASPFWRTNLQGLTIGAGGLMLRPRDMAKIGYLYLRGGRWRERQLLPPSWIDAVNHATIDMHASFDGGLRYANLFWAMPDRHIFMAVGDHCQLIMVLPGSDIVAVITARNYCPFRKVAGDIAGAVRSDTALPPAPEAAARLAAEIQTVSQETVVAVAAPPMAATISDTRYTFPDNALDISAMRLHLTGVVPRYELDITLPNADGRLFEVAGPLGLDGVFRKGAATAFGVPAAKAAWSDETTLDFDFQYVGLDEQRRVTLNFGPGGATLRGKARNQREVTVASESWAAWLRHPLHRLATLIRRMAASSH